MKSKDLLKNFARFVEYYRPGFILVENVPGIMTNKNSILPYFLNKLKSLGYENIIYKVVDMSKYGVPQSRKRFSLIATRILGLNLKMPNEDVKVSILRDSLGSTNGFPKIPAGHKDSSDFNHTTAGLSDVSLKRISKTGLRVYSKAKDLPQVFGGLGIAIISTSKGLMTDRKARKENLGGEVLCYVW